MKSLKRSSGDAKGKEDDDDDDDISTLLVVAARSKLAISGAISQRLVYADILNGLSLSACHR